MDLFVESEVVTSDALLLKQIPKKTKTDLF
jgi:hypothetical protein